MIRDSLDMSDFAPRQGEIFQIETGVGESMEGELVEIRSLGYNPRRGGGKSDRQSFALEFRVPKTWQHPQKIYRLTHAALGEMNIFLVPIGPDDQGMRLEAIFNYA